MQDNTLRMNGYRESVRHLWNSQVLSVVAGSSDHWAVRDEFDDACRILFGILVVAPLAIVAP